MRRQCCCHGSRRTRLRRLFLWFFRAFCHTLPGRGGRRGFRGARGSRGSRGAVGGILIGSDVNARLLEEDSVDPIRAREVDNYILTSSSSQAAKAAREINRVVMAVARPASDVAAKV